MKGLQRHSSHYTMSRVKLASNFDKSQGDVTCGCGKVYSWDGWAK